MTREEALERLKYIAREDDSHITKAMIEWLDTHCPKMTKEEIINGLKLTIGQCLFDPYTMELSTEQISFTEKLTIDACKGAIDLLEQEHTKEETLKYEPILDKIRAEIDELEIYYDNDYFSGNKDPMYKCNEVSQIIDRYRTERSEKE